MHRIVSAVCHFGGVATLLRMWTLFASDGSQQQLRQANPLGQIPRLQFEDGSVLTEGAAILIELGLRYRVAGLLPRDAAAGAGVCPPLVRLNAK